MDPFHFGNNLERNFRWLPQNLHLPIGKRFPQGYKPKPETRLPHMAVESVGKHIEGIQKDDDIIILSGLMWNKQHWGKISDASLTWKLTPGLEVGPISNQFVQCAFPLPLLEATQREQTGRLGPYMRCSFNLQLGYWVSNKRQPKSATIYHSYKTHMLGTIRGPINFPKFISGHLLPEDLHREWCMLLKQLQILVILVPELRVFSASNSRWWFQRWFSRWYVDWGILESDPRCPFDPRYFSIGSSKLLPLSYKLAPQTPSEI